MYIALSVEYGRDDQLIFAQQLGVDQVVMSVGSWDAETLASAKNRVEKAALTLAGLEGLPLDDADRAQTSLQAAGKAGIGLVAGAAHALGTRMATGRGGALVGRRQHTAVNTNAVRQIIDTAAATGVQLALSEDRPGAGIDLDLSALDDIDPVEEIRSYGARLLMVRAGNIAAGREAFLNEGEGDLPGVLLALQETGFTGPVRALPPPGMVGDSAWGHKGRAYDLGYLKAILQTIESR